MTEYEAQLSERLKTLPTQELLDMYRDGTLTVDTFRLLLSELENRGVSAAQLDDHNFNPNQVNARQEQGGGRRFPVLLGLLTGIAVVAGVVLIYLLL
jgi:hypothetical protein